MVHRIHCFPFTHFPLAAVEVAGTCRGPGSGSLNVAVTSVDLLLALLLWLLVGGRLLVMEKRPPAPMPFQLFDRNYSDL